MFSDAFQALKRRRLLRQLSSPRPSKLAIETLELRRMLSANPLLPDTPVAGPATPAAAVGAVPGELLVGFKATATANEIRGLYQTQGLKKLEQLYRSERVHRVAVPEAAAEAVMRALAHNPLVEYAEPNHVATALFTPNDPFYAYQWHLANSTYGGIHVDKAWDTTRGAGAVVAVLDTGVAYENYSDATGQYSVAPDLAETRFVPGYDFINGDAHPNDDHSHGTHVAGTIAQNSNNGQGASGVAFESSIMPVKVLGKDGSGSHSAIANGIRWAADQGAHVINMSLGASSPSTTLADALAYAHGKGVTIVAAAGNDGQNAVSYPAAYDAYVIAVSATRFDERVAGYSNYGASIDLAAPGGDVSVDQNGDGYVDGVLQSTFNPNTKDPSDFGYYFFQGTSMAAPHVAGVAALIVSQGVTDPDQVRQILQSSAEDKGASGVDDYYGHGIIDAAAALASIASPNTSPVASNDAASLDEDASVAISVLSNDQDADGDSLTVSAVSNASNGGLVIHSDQTITYTPKPNYNGSDSFTYTVSDGRGGSDTAEVSLSIAAVNDPPVAIDDSATTAKNTAVTIDALANDSDPDGDMLSISGFAATSGGGTLEAFDGALTYTPPTDFTGSDSFTYTVSDGNGGSATATVTVTVQDAPSGTSAINFANYAIGSYAGTQDRGTANVEDGGATLHLAGNGWKQIAYPYQVTADTILEFDFSSPVQGEIHSIGFDRDLGLSGTYGFTLYGTQSWGRSNFDNYAASAPAWQHYQIPVGQFYTGSFEYLFFANDNDASSSHGEGYFANVKVYESGTANASPTAQDDQFTVSSDSSGNVLDVLANDSTSPDSGETLTITAVSAGSAGGAVSIASGSQLQYTPVSGFSGEETFTYTVSDGNGGSATATVTVTVQDAPSGTSAINFANYAIGSYGGTQDRGSAAVEDRGATLHLAGNGWKQIAFPYQVTADTILEFDFSSPVQGEIHSIGFDRDLGLSEPYGFTLYGTQSWGRSNFDDYAASTPAWKHYQIPVGQFYTGSFEYLFFANDNDASSSNGEGYFSNVKVYESGTGTTNLSANNDVTPSYQAPPIPTALAAGTTETHLGTPSGMKGSAFSGDATSNRRIPSEADADLGASSQPVQSLSAAKLRPQPHESLATERDPAMVELESGQWSLRVDDVFGGGDLDELLTSTI